MEKHLITITVRERVEPDPNAVVRATTNAQQMKWKLWLLGGKGSRRCLQGQQVIKYTNDQYMQAARAGLLYSEREPEVSELWAFSPHLDGHTGLPQLMEPYDFAFAKRSPEGVQGKQVDMNAAGA